MPYTTKATNKAKSERKSLRNWVYELLHTPEIETRLELVLRAVIMALIFLSLVSVILESVPELNAKYSYWFNLFETVTIIAFSFEYVLRVWSITESPDLKHPIFGRLRYVISFMALVDLIAVLPFYLPSLIAVDMRFLRALRLIRLLRILKIGSYSRALNMMGRVVRKKRPEILVSLFIVLILLLVSASLMYVIENEAQPEVFRSIPHALWWAVATLTTVGYGDIYPITVLGKVCAAIISILGIGLFALPSGILVAGFVDEMQDRKQKETLCPNCGSKVLEH